MNKKTRQSRTRTVSDETASDHVERKDTAPELPYTGEINSEIRGNQRAENCRDIQESEYEKLVQGSDISVAKALKSLSKNNAVVKLFRYSSEPVINKSDQFDTSNNQEVGVETKEKAADTEKMEESSSNIDMGKRPGKSYSCNVCKKNFKDASSLRYHMIFHNSCGNSSLSLLDLPPVDVEMQLPFGNFFTAKTRQVKVKAPADAADGIIHDLKESFEIKVDLSPNDVSDGTKNVEVLLRNIGASDEQMARIGADKRKCEAVDSCYHKKLRGERKSVNFFSEVINCELLNSNGEDPALCCLICKRCFKDAKALKYHEIYHPELVAGEDGEVIEEEKRIPALDTSPEQRKVRVKVQKCDKDDGSASAILDLIDSPFKPHFSPESRLSPPSGVDQSSHILASPTSKHTPDKVKKTNLGEIKGITSLSQLAFEVKEKGNNFQSVLVSVGPSKVHGKINPLSPQVKLNKFAMTPEKVNDKLDGLKFKVKVIKQEDSSAKGIMGPPARSDTISTNATAEFQANNNRSPGKISPKKINRLSPKKESPLKKIRRVESKLVSPKKEVFVVKTETTNSSNKNSIPGVDKMNRDVRQNDATTKNSLRNSETREIPGETSEKRGVKRKRGAKAQESSEKVSTTVLDPGVIPKEGKKMNERFKKPANNIKVKYENIVPTRQSERRMSVENKPYRCNHCPLSFSTVVNKVIHERTHEKEKPLECTYCEMRFAMEISRMRHIKIHKF